MLKKFYKLYRQFVKKEIHVNVFCALLVAWAIVTCIPTLSSLCFVLELLKCLCMQCAVNVTPLSKLFFCYEEN